jgi:hypothetical protein
VRWSYPPEGSAHRVISNLWMLSVGMLKYPEPFNSKHSTVPVGAHALGPLERVSASEGCLRFVFGLSSVCVRIRNKQSPLRCRLTNYLFGAKRPICTCVSLWSSSLSFPALPERPELGWLPCNPSTPSDSSVTLGEDSRPSQTAY